MRGTIYVKQTIPCSANKYIVQDITLETRFIFRLDKSTVDLPQYTPTITIPRLYSLLRVRTNQQTTGLTSHLSTEKWKVILQYRNHLWSASRCLLSRPGFTSTNQILHKAGLVVIGSTGDRTRDRCVRDSDCLRHRGRRKGELQKLIQSHSCVVVHSQS